LLKKKKRKRKEN